MVTELPRHQSLALFRAGAALRFRTPLWTRTAVSAIHGRPRVEEVELTDLDSGAVRRVACDTVVFTRRLDPRPRARRDGGARDGPGHARPGGGRRAAHLTARRIRRRQPAARRRDGRRGRARRPPRAVPRPRRSWRTAAPGRTRASRSSASRRCSGSLRTSWCPERARRHAGASRSAPRVRAAPAGARSRRAAARSGRVASRASCPAARPPAARMDRGGRRGRRPVSVRVATGG